MAVRWRNDGPMAECRSDNYFCTGNKNAGKRKAVTANTDRKSCTRASISKKTQFICSLSFVLHSVLTYEFAKNSDRFGPIFREVFRTANPPTDRYFFMGAPSTLFGP